MTQQRSNETEFEQVDAYVANLEDASGIADVIIARAQAARYAIVGEWLVDETGECTCGTGGMDGYGHERGCGQEPIYKVDELLSNYRAQCARAERAEAQRDKALVLLADAIPDPKGAMDSPQWHRRMDALAAGLSLQEEQPTHLVGAGGWRACDTAADWAGSDTAGVTCAECLATTTDVLQEEQE